MSADHIRAMFAAIDSRKFGSLPEFFAPDIIYERPGFAPIEGLSDLLDFYANRRPIALGEHLLDATVVEASRAVAIGLFQGVLKDGQAVAERFADAYKFSEGRIIRRCTYFFRPAI